MLLKEYRRKKTEQLNKLGFYENEAVEVSYNGPGFPM